VTRRRPRILVLGGGLAGITAAKLLRDRGADVRIVAGPRRPGRIVAIPIETLGLAADLFGVDLAALQIGPRVERRRVDWAAGSAATVAQVAFVCDIADFAAALARPLRDAGCLAVTTDDDADWILEASGRPARDAMRAGERVGQFARVAGMACDRSIAVTATSTGWVFAAPHPAGGLAVLLASPSAALGAVSRDDVAERLAEAGYVTSARDIAEIGEPESIAPALAQPPHAGARLTVGDAALALDPLRGDGAGFAFRGALLAQAVLAAIERGEDRERCLAHYAGRLRAVFASHLHGCVPHYRAARHAAIWRHEVADMEALARRLAVDSFGFRVQGRDLVAMPAATQPHATP
jgi:flavin-dependent dehydrogenase